MSGQAYADALARLVPVPDRQSGACVWCPGDFDGDRHETDCPYVAALLLEGATC